MILFIYFTNSLGKHTINNNSRVVTGIIFFLFIIKMKYLHIIRQNTFYLYYDINFILMSLA